MKAYPHTIDFMPPTPSSKKLIKLIKLELCSQNLKSSQLGNCQQIQWSSFVHEQIAIFKAFSGRLEFNGGPLTVIHYQFSLLFSCKLSWFCSYGCKTWINPWHLSICMHMLHTVLYMFPKLLTKTCLTIKSFFYIISWWSFPIFSWP